jgi:hypothetical protein
LPGQVGRRGVFDGGAQLRVRYGGEHRGELVGRRPPRWDDARGACLRRPPIHRRQLPDSESHFSNGEAPLCQSRAHLVAQERQLVRPDAARDEQGEHTVLKRQGPRAIGDARADGVTPHRGRDGGPLASEARLAGPFQDRFEPLRGE